MGANRFGREGRADASALKAWTAVALGVLMVSGMWWMSASATPVTEAQIGESGPSARPEAWSGITPGDSLRPGVFSTTALPSDTDAFPIDAVTWSGRPAIDSQAAQTPTEPAIEPLAIPLPTAGWAGLMLLISMGMWRRNHLRRLAQH